jgi:hypothetical protein
LRECRRDTAEQVEHQEFGMAKLVFDIVAEDPKIQHVAEQVEPASMHEHGAQHSRRFAGGIGAEPARNKGPLFDERLAAVQLDEEDQDVENNQYIGDNGDCSAPTVIVANRKHGQSSSTSPTGTPLVMVEASENVNYNASACAWLLWYWVFHSAAETLDHRSRRTASC